MRWETGAFKKKIGMLDDHINYSYSSNSKLIAWVREIDLDWNVARLLATGVTARMVIFNVGPKTQAVSLSRNFYINGISPIFHMRLDWIARIWCKVDITRCENVCQLYIVTLHTLPKRYAFRSFFLLVEISSRVRTASIQEKKLRGLQKVSKSTYDMVPYTLIHKRPQNSYLYYVAVILQGVGCIHLWRRVTVTKGWHHNEE